MNSKTIILTAHVIIAILGLSTIGTPFALISYFLSYTISRNAGILISCIVSAYVTSQYSNIMLFTLSIIHPSIILWIFCLLFIFSGTSVIFIGAGELIRHIVLKRLK